MVIKDIFRGLLEFLTGGDEDSLSQKDRTRIAAVNIFALLLVPILLMYAFFFKAVHDHEMLFVSVLILAGMCFLPVLFNFLGLHSLALLTYVYQTPPLIFLYATFLGRGLGIQYFFIVAFAYPFVFFKPDEKLKALIFFFYNAAFIFLFEYGEFSFLPSFDLTGEINNTIRITVHAILMIFSFVLFLSFYQIIIKGEQQILKTNEEIKKAYKVKEDFLATMSHELRTPLNAVVTITGLLDENPQHEDRHKLLRILRFSSNNLLSIINDILDFTKLESSKIQIENEDEDIRKLLQDIKDTYKNLAAEKNLKLGLTIDDQLAEVYKVDQVKLGQILGNLISNAIKYTDEGEVHIYAMKMNAEDDLFDEIAFEVSDTGAGISARDMEHIFDSFTQVKSVLTRKTGGTGLGLAIVKKLLTLYDSDISAQSELNVGSKFSFTLKLKRGGPIDAPVQEQFEKLQNKKILLVEDNAINAIVAEKLLVNWGVSSDKASNGEVAVELCQKTKYDLILMDLHMPVMDGFEAARVIREEENINQFTPIYVLTADITGEQNEKYNKYFDGFLTKPIQREKLRNVLVSRLA